MASTDSSQVAQLERTIVQGILTRALPALTGLSVLSLAPAVLTFQENPLRIVGSVVALVACSASWALMRRDQPFVAVGALAAALAFISGFAMLFNGGVRAPAAALPMAMIAVVGWGFGRTAATRATVLAAGAYVLVGALSSIGVLRAPTPPGPLVHAAFLSIYVWIAWLTTAGPQAQLREALEDALQKRRALEQEEARRAQSEFAFRAVFEHTPHALALITPEGLIHACNPSALKLFRAGTATAVVDRPLLDVLAWPEPDAMRAALGGATTARQALRVTLGAARYELVLAPFTDAGGTLRYVILEAQDVTALLEEEERKAHARRLEAVGRLASGVAHDFNNVLAVVVASSEVLREELSTKQDASQDATDALDSIRDVSMRASDLSRRLLNLSRKTPTRRRVVSMHELLESTTKLLSRTLPSNITIARETRAEEDAVLADDASLESALLNLAVNARDAMPRGGTLTFATRNVELNGDACRRLGVELTPGRYLRIDVRDTGTGIEPELRERIFEPFFTTKGDGRGTGIGLASVFGAMRSHGGLVQVESELGRGTTFMLDLPLAPPDVASEKERQPRSLFAGVRALVVDDEPALLRAVAHQLEGLGMPCVRAGSAEQAWEQFVRAPQTFQVAVLDQVLPGETGASLAARLLATAPQLKVIIVTGSARDEVPTHTLPQERIAVVGKPFTSQVLRQTLEQLLGPRASA